jgi:hypothetical protein
MQREVRMDTAFERYEQMLYELHGLIDSGHGDGDAAIDLRQRMHVLWPVLTIDQVRRMERLGARLKSLRAARGRPR